MISINKTLINLGIKVTNKNEQLYKMAFTHNSYANEKNLDYNYQRLEFLGDAILSKEISYFLYINFPNKHEGEITNWRSIIVRKDTLASISSNLKLGKSILLGHGEIKTKGYAKSNILADVLESLIAAIYLDKGEVFIRKFIRKYIINFIISENYLFTIIDYKTQLQEQLQSTNQSMPKYKVLREIKKNSLLNNKILYEVVVTINNIHYGLGKGKTIKDAEQDAAKHALGKLAITTTSIKTNFIKKSKNN